MGCYGVGVSRSLAAVVEQHNDEHGIVWPVSVAPYEVAVIPLDPKKEECANVCDQIVEGLCAEGIEVVVDDRDERPGFKFADNDLMGFPYQVVWVSVASRMVLWSSRTVPRASVRTWRSTRSSPRLPSLLRRPAVNRRFCY
mgnify:CR=1 FL=1